MSSTAQGVKLFVIVLLYFFFMTITVYSVSHAFSGGFSSSLNLLKPDTCSEPRDIYDYYLLEPKFTTDNFEKNHDNKPYLSQLECRFSRGVLSEQDCLAIEGCSWSAPPHGILRRILTLEGLIPIFGEDDDTCIGTIAADHYNINTTTSILSTHVAEHVNSQLNFGRGSICTHPNVIYNITACELFSCTWLTNARISQLKQEQIEIEASRSTVRKIMTMTSDMFTLRFDFGFENDLITYILNFLIFWLPLILLIFAVYLMIPFI